MQQVSTSRLAPPGRCQDTLPLVQGRPEHVEVWKADLTKAVEAGLARTYLYLCGSFHYPQLRAFLRGFSPPIFPVIVGVQHNEVEIELHQEALIEDQPTGGSFEHAWGIPIMAEHDPIKGYGEDALSPGDWCACTSFEFEKAMRALADLRGGRIDSAEWLNRLLVGGEVCESTSEFDACDADLSIPN
jgi:hypothetical protein